MSWSDDGPPDDWSDVGSGPKIKVFYCGELEFAGASESDTTGRKVKFKLIRPPAEIGHLNPFSQATLRRGGRAGSRFRLSLAAIDPDHGDLLLEVMLLAWADGPAGSTVTLLLDADLMDHPFMASRRPEPKTAGTRWMAVFADIMDDETIATAGPIQQISQNGYEHTQSGHKQKLSNQAAILVKSKAFHDWIAKDERYIHGNPNDTLKFICGVGSKSELDTNHMAAVKFLSLRTAFNSR